MSKKADQKKKEKIVEDKTFGLKNKNRSAKVQAYVKQVSQSVNQARPQDKAKLAEQEARRRAKAEKKAQEEEFARLLNQPERSEKKTPGAEGAGEGEGDEFVYDPDNYLFRPEDFEEVEHDERRLEEQLEAEREALQGRTDLTPVTEESFQRWKTQKREEAAAAEAARLRKAKGGDGKLRGWDLWQMDQELFVDDDDADETYEREEMEEPEEEDYDLSWELLALLYSSLLMFFLFLGFCLKPISLFCFFHSANEGNEETFSQQYKCCICSSFFLVSFSLSSSSFPFTKGEVHTYVCETSWSSC